MKPRTWNLHAHETAAEPGYAHVCTERQIRFWGNSPAVPVLVTEDPDGPFMGWIPTGEDVPIFIQRTRLFPMAFNEPWENRERKGYGTAVHLRVEVRP